MSAADGPLLVLMPGLGAVATTFVGGVELARRRLAPPVGSFTQLGRLRWPGDGGGPGREVRELLPLAGLESLRFGAWDVAPDDAATVASRAQVFSAAHLEVVGPLLRQIRPRPGVHDPERMRRLRADHVLPRHGHRHTIARLRRDIEEMREQHGAGRAVMVCTVSTETHRPAPPWVRDLDEMERAIDADAPGVTPTMLYAYAALHERVPFANATPNAAVELPALAELATRLGVPVAGKDLKSGQTLIKTALAPALKARLLGLHGWFSTNILGNRDGEVLDDPQAFRSKELTKSGVLDSILEPAVHPELYGGYHHKVSIHYYPPRGDDKEGWDNVDIFGWMGYPMQVKVDFLCRDSILAAPLVLDLALLLDAASRGGRVGVQEWLSFYFKSPSTADGTLPVHDLFAQHRALESGVLSLADAARTSVPAAGGPRGATAAGGSRRPGGHPEGREAKPWSRR